MDEKTRESGKGRRKKQSVKGGRTDTSVERNPLPAETSPPPVKEMKGRMTPDEKVEEASMESMDGSDPPGYLPVGVGAPDERRTEPEEEAIRRLAYEIWEREGRQSGRDEEYWQRARQQLQGLAAERAKKASST